MQKPEPTPRRRGKGGRRRLVSKSLAARKSQSLGIMRGMSAFRHRSHGVQHGKLQWTLAAVRSSFYSLANGKCKRPLSSCNTLDAKSKAANSTFSPQESGDCQKSLAATQSCRAGLGLWSTRLPGVLSRQALTQDGQQGNGLFFKPPLLYSFSDSTRAGYAQQHCCLQHPINRQADGHCPATNIDFFPLALMADFTGNVGK